jgi:hypothetical protein
LLLGNIPLVLCNGSLLVRNFTLPLRESSLLVLEVSLLGGLEDFGGVERDNPSLGICHGGDINVDSSDCEVLLDDVGFRLSLLVYLPRPAEAAETRAIRVKREKRILSD